VTNASAAAIRLVPYKSPTYIYGQATALNVALLIAMSAARVVQEQQTQTENVFLLPVLAMIVTAPLFYAGAAVWARYQNLELVPYPETLRRYFDDRSARSPVDSGSRTALFLGSFFLIAGLMIMPIKIWPALVPVVGFSLFFGFVAGTYSALYARRWRESTQNPGAVHAVSSAERSGRHYFGYALGLAAAYALAAYLETNAIAAIAIIVAFVAGKFVGDLLLPQPPYNFALPLRVGALDPLRYLIFGAMRWGVPLAALCFLVTRTLVPNATLEELTPAVALPLIIGRLWGILFWLIALLARWGRKVIPETAATTLVPQE
jgi:hypothetical protein